MPNLRVDETRVMALLRERDEYRRRRDFDGADRLKDQLFAMNVRMDDRDRSWVNAGWGLFLAESSSSDL